MKLPLIPQDKANHFVYGAILYLLFSIVLSPVNSLVFTSLIAIGKEMFDRISKRGNAEALDFLWTLMGAFVVYMGGFTHAIIH